MISRWLMIVMCTSGLAYTAAFPTVDEYVTVADDYSTSTVPGFDAATEQPNAPIKLTEMRVRSDVALRYARTSVVTHVRNPGRQPQQAVFRMLLPDTAFISGFTMILGGKSYKAYVKEKQEAKQIYTQAVSQGVGAAHVATKARDSNHFMVTVNVEGNSTAIFDLRYEEFLVRRNGVYNHAINLHPGVLVPTLEVIVHIRESQKITKLRVPKLRTGNEIDAMEKDSQNSKAVIEMNSNEKEVTVTFTPDLLEQRRLARIYGEKSKQSNEQNSTVLGQFVVQYDVERPNNGEILVNDGYFVHFLAPTSLTPLSKHAIFVLDTSGSMQGRKIEQLRNAMEAILSDLNPNDYFSIVEFNSYYKVHELKEADEARASSYLDSNHDSQAPPALASPENIAKAKIIVSRLIALGITDIYSALNKALDLARKGVSANTADDTEKKEKDLEAVIIFLTDGEANEGETNIDRIISLISEKNSGDKRASLYSLAFGEDADRNFLRKLSLRNEGFMRHIYEASDAALQLHDFYRQVSSPLLAHVQFLYPSQQIKEGSVSRNQFRTVNAGSEVTVVGKVADDAMEITPQVLGYCSSEDGLGRKRYEISPRVPVNRAKNEYLPLERLWAYLTIKQLLDKRDAGDDHGTGENSPEKRALDIALTHAFVTPLTSLVVVKPNETNAVDVESVDGKSEQSNAPKYRDDWTTGDRILGGIFPSITGISNTNRFNYYGGRRNNNYGGGRAYLRSNNNYEDRIALSSNSGYDISNTNHLNIYGGRRNNNYRGWSNNNNVNNFGSGGYDGGWSNNNNANYFGWNDDKNSWSNNNNFKHDDGWNDYDDWNDNDDGWSNNNYAYHFGWGGNYHAPRFNRPFTPTSPVVYTPPQTTSTVSPKGDYRLEGFDWTSSLLDISNDALVFQENGTQLILKLTKDINAPTADSGDVGCLNSTLATDTTVGANDNTGSVCVYLTRCLAARTITANEYKKSYCFVNNSYAGVCCPRNEVDKKP